MSKYEPGTAEFWEAHLSDEIRDHEQTKRQRDEALAALRKYSTMFPVTTTTATQNGRNIPNRGDIARAAILSIEGET